MKLLHRSLCLLFLGSLATVGRAQTATLADSINQLGIDLYHQMVSRNGDAASGGAAPSANLLLSPYSIQTALAMAYAGADGATRDEMKRVLHLPSQDALPAQFEKLRADLAVAARNEVELNVGNRLYGRRGYAFRRDFLALLKERYAAPLEEMDFAKNVESAATINRWIEQQTKEKIRDLIPPGALSATTRLVLVNALYFRAPWTTPFEKYATKPAPFYPSKGQAVDVPTMHAVKYFGYAEKSGFRLVTLPYASGEFQFVVLVPAGETTLDKVVSKITPALLAECVKLPSESLSLYLPKFKIAGPSLALGDALKALGMKTAFDDPRGSANFERMAARKPDDYLKIDQVVHKTWMALDEEGTEAAAATAVVMTTGFGVGIPKPEPREVRVDRPFLFAIQHVASGACLFLGSVNDPRAE